MVGSTSTKWFFVTWFLVESEFGNVGFWGEGKTGVPGEKPLRVRERTKLKQTQPTYGMDTGIWTRATLVGGRSSHHCAIPSKKQQIKSNLLNEALLQYGRVHVRTVYNVYGP